MAARVFDTPTPPSQSYSAHPLQTSLRPTTSTALPKSRLNQQVQYTSGLDGMSESSFTSTDFGRPEGVVQQQQQQQQRRTQPAYNKSVGFGDAGMGLGMDDRERFADLYRINNNKARDTATAANAGRAKRTRVDEYSDISLDTSDAEDPSNTTASEDDEFSARLAGRGGANNNYQRNTSTPFPNHNNNNQSKSAFDGMARELRKEFERIMDGGKAARTYGSHSNNDENNPYPLPPSSSAISPSAAQRRYSLQQPPLNVAPAAIPPPATRQPLPRGVAPRRSPVKTSERPTYERKDSTPTAIRTFGQELPIYRQASQQQQQQPSRTSFAVADPSPKQQNKHSLSPFQVLSSQGIQPPNNTRATSHQSIFSQAPQAVPSTALLDSPDRQSIPSSYSPLRVPDITGLTDGLSSPSRATSNPSSHRVLANTLGVSPKHNTKTGNRSVEDPALSSALVSLRKRLDALEQENARSESKVAELEDKLAAAASTQQIPASSHQEDLVATLRGEIDRLQTSIQQQALALAALQAQKSNEEEAHLGHRHYPDQQRPSLQTRQGDQVWMQEFVMLRDTLGSLADQVAEVRRVLEDVLDSLRKIPSVPRHHPRDQELLREPSTPTRRSSRQRREELLASPPQNISRQHSAPEYYYAPSYKGPLLDRQRQQSKPYQQRATSAPLPENIAHRVARNFSAPPNYTEPLLDRAERILSNLPPSIHSHAQTTCEVCKSRAANEPQAAQPRHSELYQQDDSDAILRAAYDENSSHRHASRGAPKQRHEQDEQLPMQTVISRALRDLEDDFSTHKRIYIELSDEYKRMDPATPDVGKRKILALHLKESIDVLELKADEIKRLYDLLHYRSELQQTQDAARLRNLGQGRHI